jgi:hypothetical protein
MNRKSCEGRETEDKPNNAWDRKELSNERDLLGNMGIHGVLGNAGELPETRSTCDLQTMEFIQIRLDAWVMHTGRDFDWQAYSWEVRQQSFDMHALSGLEGYDERGIGWHSTCFSGLGDGMQNSADSEGYDDTWGHSCDWSGVLSTEKRL